MNKTTISLLILSILILSGCNTFECNTIKNNDNYMDSTITTCKSNTEITQEIKVDIKDELFLIIANEEFSQYCNKQVNKKDEENRTITKTKVYSETKTYCEKEIVLN